jgi:hypothetical protein
MNQSPSPTSAGQVKVLTIIHLAFLAGMALFALVTFMLTQSTAINFDTSDTYLFIVIPFAIVAVFGSMFMYNQQLSPLVNEPNLSGKLGIYQTACIIRYAILEGAALFSITVYLLTANFLYLLIALAIMSYFFAIRPTKDNIAGALSLSYEETLGLG